MLIAVQHCVLNATSQPQCAMQPPLRPCPALPRSAKSPHPGPLNEGVSDGATRGFKHRAKTLLKKRVGNGVQDRLGDNAEAEG